MEFDGATNLVDEKCASLPEQALTAEIAEYLADKLWFELGPGNTNGEIYNLGQSNYEEACRALNLVGVYQQAEHYTLHRVLMPWEQVRDHVASLDKISAKASNLLLSAFVENSINYHGWFSSTKRAFNCPDGGRRLMDLLVCCGYAKQVGNNYQYQWTEKISPFMQRWHLWTETGDARCDLARSGFEKKSADMAATIPERIKRKILVEMASGSLPRAVSVVNKHWDGEKWLLFPSRAVKKPDSDSTLDMETARTLVERLGILS